MLNIRKYGQNFKVGDLICWWDYNPARKVDFVPEYDSHVGLIIARFNGFFEILINEEKHDMTEQWVYDHYKLLEEEP